MALDHMEQSFVQKYLVLKKLPKFLVKKYYDTIKYLEFQPTNFENLKNIR